MLDGIIADIKTLYDEAHTMYTDVNNGDEDTLQLFAFISLLSQDVYIKKLLIEKLVDGYKQKVEQEDKRVNGIKPIAVGISDFDSENDIRVQDVFERADSLMYEDKKKCKSEINNVG